tara:strand:- start:652 stop:1311 length:660 start_codon:yes stop_codon:yes gene_type:complete
MNLLFSSVGKKLQVAITGVFLSTFLIFHLANNLVLFAGEEYFNQMVFFLESIKPVIRIMEAGLLFIVCVHVINAIYLTILNKKASGENQSNVSGKVSSVNSRTMAISGITILLFFVIHLRYIWYTYQAHLFGEGETYYTVLLRNQWGYLGHTPTAVFYIISIFLIGSHLRHGFSSALKTFGVLENSSFGFLYKLSFIFWALIPALFILIVLSIQLGIIK